MTAPLRIGMGAHEPLVQVAHMPDESAPQQDGSTTLHLTQRTCRHI